MRDPIKDKLKKEAEVKAAKGTYKRYSISFRPQTYTLLNELLEQIEEDTGHTISRAKLVEGLIEDYAKSILKESA